jgi:hypothetical protein
MEDIIGHFSLWGDLDVDQITASLDLQPSQVFLKGTLIEGASGPATRSTWDFHCPSNLTMQEQVDFLLGFLWPRAERLQPLTAQFYADMNVTAESKDGNQAFTLKPEVMQQLMSLNITLNCFYGKDEIKDGD